MFGRKEKQLSYNAERPSLITITRPSSVIAEQFKTIRTNINFSMIDKELKTISVTSAGPGAGKSTIAANLAVTFAQEGRRVLLVDTDLRKPTVHKTFRISNKAGLTSLLTDRDTPIDDITQYNDIDNLSIITSGPIPTNPAELLSSNRFMLIKSELEKLFDLIIFDLPPVIAVTDAQIVYNKTDGTIFVINKDGAEKEMVLKAKELLEKGNANVLGAIFNRVEVKNDHYYYAYYGESK